MGVKMKAFPSLEWITSDGKQSGEGMFEYLHGFLNVSRDRAIYLKHEERLKLQGDSKYFHQDGFHPGDVGHKLWVDNILVPFLKTKTCITSFV